MIELIARIVYLPERIWVNILRIWNRLQLKACLLLIWLIDWWESDNWLRRLVRWMAEGFTVQNGILIILVLHSLQLLLISNQISFLEDASLILTRAVHRLMETAFGPL